MMHPVTEALGDRHLGRNAKTWTLNVSAALEVGPGARDQALQDESIPNGRVVYMAQQETG